MFADCKPFRDVLGPRPGMVGELWDFYVALALALAGAEHRIVWLHPSYNRGFESNVR